jgi:hypothetical protein
MALSLSPARIGDLFECNEQTRGDCGSHLVVLPSFVRMASDSAKTTKNSGRIPNADYQGKSNAIL